MLIQSEWCVLIDRVFLLHEAIWVKVYGAFKGIITLVGFPEAETNLASYREEKFVKPNVATEVSLNGLALVQA